MRDRDRRVRRRVLAEIDRRLDSLAQAETAQAGATAPARPRGEVP